MSEIDFPKATVPPPDGHAMIVPAPSKPVEVARLFVEKDYDDPRGVLLLHHRGLFYAWLETHWLELEERSVRSALYRWLEHAVYVKDGELVPFDPSKGRVTNVVDALQSIVHISERVEAPAWLGDDGISEEIVAMQNGLLAHSARELHSHTPQFFNEYVLPFAFDPSAPEPRRWHQFLRELWGEDQQSIDTFQEIMGYLLVGGTAQQKIFMLVGPKRTGKGTILRILTALLGVENVAAPTLSSLATNFGLQPLVGKPLAAISDARLGSRSDSPVAVERLLSISGEDSITIDRKYKDPWTGRLPTRFLVLTNEIPRFTDASGALASRFVILTLTNSFYGREDTALTDKLLVEAPAIFNWCLDGLDRLSARGHFVQPDTARSALQHLEDLASPVSAFVRDRCHVDAEVHIEKDELWKAWREWCTDEGAHSGRKAVFVRDLRAAVPAATPSRLGPRNNRVHVIRGISLRQDETAAATPDTPDTDNEIDPVSGMSGVESIVSQSMNGYRRPLWDDAAQQFVFEEPR